MTLSTLIYNASIWQWKDARSYSEDSEELGFAVQNYFITTEGGFIKYVSAPNEEPPAKESFEVVVNAQGRLVLPGLIDSHIHIALFGESQYFVDLSSCYSIEELQQAVSQHISKHPTLPWVTGVNWDQTKLGRYPTRHDLAAVPTEKPIFLYRACWHIGVANDAALQLAQIIGMPEGQCSESPPGGVIEKDEAGEPTGVLKERACELVIAAQQRQALGSGGNQAAALQQKMQFLKEGMDICARVGLTMVQTNDEGALRAYKELQAQEALPLRIFLTPVHADLQRSPTESNGIAGLAPFRPPCFAKEGEGAEACSMESRLLMERVKIFSDGSLGAETAALRVFSADKSDAAAAAPGMNDKGVLVYERTVLADMIVEAYRAGYRVEIHAIGDAAAEQVLSALDDSESILAASPQCDSAVQFCGRAESQERRRHWRPILTHCQVLGADLIERMAEKGIVANVQPSFVPTDMQWVRNRIHGSQLEHSYVWKSLLLHPSGLHSGRETGGLRVAGGSDAPIETPNPFTGMYDAIFRSNKRRLKAGEEEAVFHPQEALTFSQALWMYTIGGAYAAAVEDRLGRIQPGFVADLVLVDAAVLEDPERLYGLLPEVVLVGGVISAVNRTPTSGASVIERSPQTYLQPSPVDTSAALSEATFFPGRGGNMLAGTRRPASQGVDVYCQPAFSLPAGLKCACILTGKYCSR